MSNKDIPRIVVDAMGGDRAPEEIVKGVAKISTETDIEVVLVGDESEIKPILDNTESNNDNIELVHTGQVITQEDSPKEALRRKKDSSLTKAARLCGEEESIHGMVSAGNTGAYVLSALKYIPQIEGVSKAAIAANYPTWNQENGEGNHSFILDIGANIYYNVEELVQIALMGMVYAGDVKEIDAPKIGLLNIGREPHKGGDPYRSVYSILDDMDKVNFIGNIEGNDLLKDVADVVVTEGFVGNIVIKTIEGAADSLRKLGKHAYNKKLKWKLGIMALSDGVKQLESFTDYSEYGGAPILGFKELTIKAHGRSDSKAIFNAIKVAAKTYQDNVCGIISRVISDFEAHFQPDQN